MKAKTLLFAIVLGLGFAAGPASAQPVMKIGSATINDVQHEYARLFAARMEKQAPGRLKIEIYPAEQLGSNSRMLEGLTLGTVEAVIGPPEFMTGIDPRFQIVGAPGIVKDMAHAERLASDPRFRNALFGFGEAKGIKGLGIMVYGPVSYASRKPIRTVADFKGLKIRVLASPMQTVAMERLGATGVPMVPSEALQALASGAIDGNRTGITLFVAFKYFDVVKTLTQIDGDGMIFATFAVGKNWYEKLPADLQKTIAEAAQAVEADANKFTFDFNRKSEDIWRQRGGEVIRITGREQAEFEKRMRSVGDEVAQKNPRIKEAYDLMVERAKATSQ